MTPFFDRATCNPFKYQLGYIDVIAIPLFDTWCDFKPNFRDILITEGLEPNRRLLTQKIDETKWMADQQTNQPKLTEQSGGPDEIGVKMLPANVMSPPNELVATPKPGKAN